MDDTKKLLFAIKKINPNAEFEASNVDNIIWKNGTTPISKADKLHLSSFIIRK